jgi:hypothetical protein
MLRLKGERDDDTLREDEVRPRLVDIEDTDQLTGKDVFPVDESNDTGYLEYDSGRPGRSLPFRGFAIAAAAFAPTFLLIFVGLPYLVGSAVPARTPTASVASPAPEIDPKAFPSSSEAARGDSRSGLDSRTGPGDPRGSLGGRMTTDPSRSTPPVPDEPKVEPSRVESPKLESPRVEPKIEERATAVAPEPVPSLPPSLPPARRAPTTPPIAPERPVPEPSRSAATVPPPAVEPRAAVEPRRAPREPSDWTPAAAFTDRAAASRLAGSIEKQGYPVEIRQDASSSRPWVVWIGAQPSGGPRRR